MAIYDYEYIHELFGFGDKQLKNIKKVLIEAISQIIKIFNTDNEIRKILEEEIISYNAKDTKRKKWDEKFPKLGQAQGKIYFYRNNKDKSKYHFQFENISIYGTNFYISGKFLDRYNPNSDQYWPGKKAYSQAVKKALSDIITISKVESSFHLGIHINDINIIASGKNKDTIPTFITCEIKE